MKSHAGHEGMVHILAERIGDSQDLEMPVHGAQSLHERLHTAFAPHENDSAPSFAGAATRQSQALENMGERLDRLEENAEATDLRGAMHDLSMAVAGLALMTTRAASETEGRIESLADTVALVSGHVASQRADMRRDHMAVANLASALATLTEEFKRFQATTQASRNEMSQNLASLQQECQQLNQRLTFVEERTAAYHAVEETVEILNRRLEGLEQTSTRREKIMARLHARAARILQSDQQSERPARQPAPNQAEPALAATDTEPFEPSA
jgi:chromosome segregation ATPase